MTVRIGVIGAGLMGADHARIVAEELSGARLQVVCDRDGKRARQVADACGAAHVAADPEEVIGRPDVDAVIVASPDFTHAPLSTACIGAGKKVLCEKPLSQSSAECVEVMKTEIAAEEKFVQLGFMRRYDQSYAEMKKALDGGTLGRAVMMHNFHRNVETPNADFTADMAITNSAPHEFDVARFILGTDYAAITAFAPRGVGDRVGPVFMVIETADGQLVNVEINNNAGYGYDVRGELVGEKGAISLADPVHSRLDVALRSETHYQPDWRPRYAEAYRRQSRDFVRFVETGRFPAVAANCWDGYCAAAVAEAGVRALREGRSMPVEMIARPEFYA